MATPSPLEPPTIESVRAFFRRLQWRSREIFFTPPGGNRIPGDDNADAAPLSVEWWINPDGRGPMPIHEALDHHATEHLRMKTMLDQIPADRRGIFTAEFWVTLAGGVMAAGSFFTGLAGDLAEAIGPPWGKVVSGIIGAIPLVAGIAFARGRKQEKQVISEGRANARAALAAPEDGPPREP